MKHLKVLFVAGLLIAGFSSSAQVEEGDFNLAANLSLNTTTGTDNNTGSWNFFSTAGYYFTDNIEAGAIVLLTGQIGAGGETTPGFGVFGSYSFMADNQVVPYAGLQIFTLSVPNSDAITSLGLNVGAKWFVREDIFINNRLDYGTVIAPSEFEGGQLTLSVGLGFTF